MAVSYDKLWVLLDARKIKRTHLAKRCGISRTTISRMRDNCPVSLDVIDRMCVELDCNIEDIVEIVDKKFDRQMKKIRKMLENCKDDDLK